MAGDAYRDSTGPTDVVEQLCLLVHAGAGVGGGKSKPVVRRRSVLPNTVYTAYTACTATAYTATAHTATAYTATAYTATATALPEAYTTTATISLPLPLLTCTTAELFHRLPNCLTNSLSLTCAAQHY